MAVGCNVGFLETEIFTIASELKTPALNLTSCLAARRLRNYGHFNISNVVVCHDPAFLETEIFTILSAILENPILEPITTSLS